MRYPIHMDLRGKRCVVVGGGKVAERKVQRLLESGARVSLVSPSATPALVDLASSRALTWDREPYQRRHLDGAFLAIAATDVSAVNAQVVRDALEREMLVSAADDPDAGNFITPAAVSRGDLTWTIFTGGSSPTLAAVLGEDLEAMYGSEWGGLATLLGVLRPAIQAIRGDAARKAGVRRIIADQRVREAIQAERFQEAEDRARECLCLSSE